MSQLSDEAVHIAITQIGKEESPIGSNWGPIIKGYLASVDIDFPASWCMAFVYWVFDQAARSIGIPTPLVKTGGVLNAWSNAASHHQTSPLIGDIFIMDFGQGHGHTGI